jgi:hypothetical protein
MREFVVKIEGLIPDSVKVALKKDLTISSDLEREVAEGAAQFGYYAVLAEKAEARHQAVELAFKLWKNTKERKLLKDHGTFKLAKDLERMVMADPNWKGYQMKMDEYREDARILTKIANAFDKKVSLIQTANANRRAEYEGGRGR